MDGTATSPAENAVAHVLATPPRAAAFIVTIYGDVVEPRGGEAWMGSLIDLCAEQGLSESLVRTAVSRLVAAGRLEGERIGRRSYYRLTAPARAEFARASRILFDPPPPPVDWLIRLGPGEPPESDGWRRLGSEAWAAPARDDVMRPDGVLLRAASLSGQEGLPEIATRLWGLEEVMANYRRFLSLFGGLAGEIEQGLSPTGVQALALRLRLVHLFRRAVLSDPRLPREALPSGWPGDEARRLFARMYIALTGAADRHVGAVFHGPDGVLQFETEAVSLRKLRLSHQVDPVTI